MPTPEESLPCDFVMRKDLGFVVTRFRGRVTDAEFVALYESLFSEEGGYAPGLGEVADLRPVESFNVSTDALRRVSELTQRGAGEALYSTVIIAPEDLSFGLARLYEGLASLGGPEQVRVVRSLAQAAGFLGLAPEVLEEALSGRAP